MVVRTKEMSHTTTNAIELGAGIEDGPADYDRNTKLTTLDRETRAIKRAAERYENLGEDASWMDAHALTHGSHYFVIPLSGEVVYVDTVSPYEGGAGTVRLLFPERDAYDEDFNPVPYAYDTSVFSLMDRMEYDGGWNLVRRFEHVSTPSCPRCHKFMGIGEDGYGLPFAQCVCGCDIGVTELLEQDAVIEVF